MHVALALNIVLSLSSQTPTSPPSAPASVQAEVEQLFAEGAALFKVNKYRAAIEKFEQAYILYPELNLVYNIARAHEALGEIDTAIAKYRMCATNPRGTEELRAKASNKLAVLTAARAGGAAAATDSSPPPAAPSTSGATPLPPAPADRGPPIAGIAGGVAGGLGIIAGAGGALFYVLGTQTHEQLQSDVDAVDDNGVSAVTREQAEQASAEGTSQKTIGVALLAGGGALVVAGAAMIVVQLMGAE